MFDFNGKQLNVGDQISHSGRLLTIKEIHSTCIVATNKENKELNIEHNAFDDNLFKVRSWKLLAQEAIDIQDACNLSAVVKSFSRAISEIRVRLDDEGKGGTDAVNSHPICVMYSSKIQSLTHSEQGMVFYDSYTWCSDLISK